MSSGWKFWIDKGGTFTDIVYITPNNYLQSAKLLSSNDTSYEDSISHGIQEIIKNKKFKNLPSNILDLKVGTTIATNALLERTGSDVLLCITKGFKDSLVIGNQQRTDIFKRHYKRKKNLYTNIIEIEERMSSKGKEVIPINIRKTKQSLKYFFNKGHRVLAITLMHSYRYNKNEKIISEIARDIGFTSISCSHKSCPIMSFIDRGHTTLADAYLSPAITNYSKLLSQKINAKNIYFMQSSGNLIDSKLFHGKDAVLSGPAGGVAAGITIAKIEKINKVIGFDMGGTSTDVWQYSGVLERTNDNTIAGIKLNIPMLKIETVASGGGSLVKKYFGRFIVGPESAGSYPGPTCYRNDGPLTVTDCNIILGRILPNKFPKCFGRNKNLPLSKKLTNDKFKKFLNKNFKETGVQNKIEDMAYDFLRVAVSNMANAIKKITYQVGYNTIEYTLLSFGSAGGQHACLVADELKIKSILIHPLAGVFSALGMGIANNGLINQISIEKVLNTKNLQYSKNQLLLKSNEFSRLKNSSIIRLRLKYKGTNNTLTIVAKALDVVKKNFKATHKREYGFNYYKRAIIIESVEEELILKKNSFSQESILNNSKDYKTESSIIEKSRLYINGTWRVVEHFNLKDLKSKKSIIGPSLFFEKDFNIVIDEGWKMTLTKKNSFLLKRISSKKSIKIPLNKPDPAMLEIFNNLFMSIAEQMGVVLKKTAQSINIKERKDFSCAIFNNKGDLIANAPHIPIHLGSMGDTVKAIINNKSIAYNKSYLHNNPFEGGTHLPDLTLVTPVFDKAKNKILFFVASRAHHSDVGGITPGSMPAFSKNIHDEGIILKSFPISNNNSTLKKNIEEKMLSGKYPSRDVKQNLNDLRAQLEASKKGISEIRKLIESFGLKTVNAYVNHIQNNAKLSILEVIKNISSGHCSLKLDNKSKIEVDIKVNNNTLELDFTGTSDQLKDNFNAPLAVTKSVILYTLRTLIDKNIPLNQGCLIPVKIKIPKKSMLSPQYPAAVVAGNVETSQVLVDLINTTLGIQAASYGTMNNLTFGNKNFGYYETICGGEGASKNNHGSDAVQCHMTNTSITDPELLEWFYPVRLNRFEIRKNSGGEGKWNGGNGVIREIVFLKHLNVTILSNRRVTKPHGINGGLNGKKGINSLVNKIGIIKKLKPCDQVKVKPGDILTIYTPGGGGYGNKKNKKD